MQKLYIVEDTSFVVSLLNSTDINHQIALEIFKKILEAKNKVRIVIPTTVLFETLFALIRNRIPKIIVQEKLWRLLMIFDVFNFSTLETTVLRLSNQIEPYILNLPLESGIQANDLIVLCASLDLECAPVLTFDKQMKTKFNNLHKKIYYVLNDKDKRDFLNLLE
ncbi:type II toxin-antitoxin system VapC family toxin [Candidatus Roizmanbacteria bacterium]|nr:type II toxin-antitoxin system VapC family toxin [Candidatus Roizmanbacteria bacterium]